MKLASLNKVRDGELIIVSSNRQKAVSAKAIAPTLQAALDDWSNLSPQLNQLYQQLNNGKISNTFNFVESDCASPLPRAYQWIDGSAYVNHVELVRKARNATMPDSFWHDPLMYQGGSDSFIPPRGAIKLNNEDWGIDLEAEIAIITDDTPMGVETIQAEQHIKLLMLVNDVSLRNLIPNELAKGFGFFQSKPSSSFSPIAVTPDELDDAWQNGKIHLPLVSHLNGELCGQPEAGIDMTFSFPQLIAHAAKSRPLGAGTIIGSGTVSNYDRSAGASCLVEKRMLEILEKGKANTPFMSFGDTVRIEMFDKTNQSIFGAIEQTVEKYHTSS
ncbi:MAG: fumarylacetoacetate hydrolase family protein [Ostreibacterium sp.]